METSTKCLWEEIDKYEKFVSILLARWYDLLQTSMDDIHEDADYCDDDGKGYYVYVSELLVGMCKTIDILS